MNLDLSHLLFLLITASVGLFLIGIVAFIEFQSYRYRPHSTPRFSELIFCTCLLFIHILVQAYLTTNETQSVFNVILPVALIPGLLIYRYETMHTIVYLRLVKDKYSFDILNEENIKCHSDTLKRANIAWANNSSRKQLVERIHEIELIVEEDIATGRIYSKVQILQSYNDLLDAFLKQIG